MNPRERLTFNLIRFYEAQRRLDQAANSGAPHAMLVDIARNVGRIAQEIEANRRLMDLVFADAVCVGAVSQSAPSN